MRIALYFVLVAVSFIGGTFFGFWGGINNYYRLDSLAGAVIDTAMYKNLEEGKLESPKGLYSMNIDQAIDNYIWYEENSMPILPSVYLADFVESKDDYIGRLVIFRREIPSKDVRHLLEGDVKESYIEAANQRDEFISEYRAKSGPNK